MPGVYLEYIKAGKFVVPVELTFQTETIKVEDDIRGLVNTSKWIERHNWKEIKAMLKPAVEACLKYNETPLENIPKSHHISYGENVSLGYLIVANKGSTPFLSLLDTKKNCWTDDEDDEDELLGIKDTVRMEDHGGEFTEFIPTKTAIRVCVVRKSIVSIDDARRIRKELGVRSEDVRNYFSSASHPSNEPGPSSMAHNQYPENFDKEIRVSEALYLRDSGNLGLTTQPAQSSSGALFNSNQQVDREALRQNPESLPKNDNESSESEVENMPRTFGDPDEIRDAARVYTHVLNRDVDSGEDPDDDMSLPDIEPNPPKKKKEPRPRKKSASLSPSKSKRLTHNNILALSQEGLANFSEEETNGKRKNSKQKRTVAVVEPMRTLPNGQISFENAIGALGFDRRRKARPGSSHHGPDKAHSSGSRSKQPAIVIIAPDDDRLTITNPPEPFAVVTPPSNSSPSKDKAAEERSLPKRKKKEHIHNNDDPYTWERLTPSPLNDFTSDSEEFPHTSDDADSDPEMPILTKMVDSDEEEQTKPSKPEGETEAPVVEKEVSKEKPENGMEVLTEQQQNTQVSKQESELSLVSPDITHFKTKAALKQNVGEPTFKRKLYVNKDEPKPNSITDEGAKNAKSNNVTERREPPKELPRPSVTKELNRPLEAPVPLSGSKSANKSGESSVKQSKRKLPATELAKAVNTVMMTVSALAKSARQGNNANTDPTKQVAKVSTKARDIPSVNTRDLQSTNTPRNLPSTSTRDLQSTNHNARDLSATKSHQEDNLNRDLKSSKNSDSQLTKTAIVQSETVTPVRRRKRLKRGQRNEMRGKRTVAAVITEPQIVETPEKTKKTGDAQTQTDDLFIVDQIENSQHISNALVKVSRSCEEISDEELYESASQRSRSRTPLHSCELTKLPTVTPIHHPALGSPNRDFFEDEGLFSFESPTIPMLSLQMERSAEVTEILTSNFSPDSPEEVSPASLSPQPGCSHWVSPPILTTTEVFPKPALMPPPIARPPRTPRKLFTQKSEPIHFSSASQDPEEVHATEECAFDMDAIMPAGSEAGSSSVSPDVGRIYNLISQPNVFQAGLGLIQKVTSKEMSAKEFERKLGEAKKRKGEFRSDSDTSKALVPVSTAVRKRDLSPDICELVPDKRLKLVVTSRRSRRDKFEDSNSNAEGGVSNSLIVRPSTDDEGSDIDGGGGDESVLLEYISRMENRAEYEPQGDEFDLSQRSYCMLSVIPQYDMKSRLYKIHSKTIRETTIAKLVEHFKAIKQDLFGIFEGRIQSLRHKIFLRGLQGRKDLRNLIVAVPFTSDQGTALITLIYDHLFPDPTMRCQYIEYVNYVLVPEVFIRIYSRLNNIPYHMAETEMRFRACYEGDVPNNPSSPSLD